MNKTQLVDKIASELEVSKKEASAFVDAYHSTITQALAEGEDVTLVGFGTFTVRDRAARMGRNPRTGEAMEIKASRSPVFKAGKGLKDAVAR